MSAHGNATPASTTGMMTADQNNAGSIEGGLVGLQVGYTSPKRQIRRHCPPRGNADLARFAKFFRSHIGQGV